VSVFSVRVCWLVGWLVGLARVCVLGERWEWWESWEWWEWWEWWKW
jgi:hypothetical protein